jgi:hypothetical protein
VILHAWSGHENNYDRSKERANAGRYEGLLPRQADGYESGASVPANKGELVGEPVQRQIKPSSVRRRFKVFVIDGTHQVQVLCSTGVGSRSLLDHLSSPIGA